MYRSLISIAEEEGIPFGKLKSRFKRKRVPMQGSGCNIRVDNKIAQQALVEWDEELKDTKMKRKRREKARMERLNEDFHV